MRRRLHYNLGAKFKTPMTMRFEREYKDLEALVADSTILEMKAQGDPPDHYVFTFNGKSLVPARDEDGVKIGDRQQVEIRLGTAYPRRMPEVHWQTSIVHPNISSSSVCLGNFSANWSPNIRLADLVEVLWDMSRLAILNPAHSYDRRAGAWEEMDRKYGFPVDKRPLRNRRFPNDVGSSELRPEGKANDIVILKDDEGSGCQFLE